MAIPSNTMVNADSAADMLEMAAAGIDEAIVAIAPFAQARGQVARLREVRAGIVRDALLLREAIAADDLRISDRMAAAIHADYTRAERIHLAPPPFRVVK